MNFNIGDYFGVKSKVQFDNSEVAEPKKEPTPTPVQQAPVVISLNRILNKLLKDVDQMSIGKYRTGMVKMENQFATEAEKKLDGISATANSVMSLFQPKSSEDGISAHDKESFTRYCDNFKALSKEEKDALVNLLTDEVKQQMSKAETQLIEDLIGNYAHKSELDAMNPFAQ